jgi:hypothetical protein
MNECIESNSVPSSKPWANPRQVLVHGWSDCFLWHQFSLVAYVKSLHKSFALLKFTVRKARQSQRIYEMAA